MWKGSLLLVDFHLEYCILEGNLKMKSTESTLRRFILIKRNLHSGIWWGLNLRKGLSIV